MFDRPQVVSQASSTDFGQVRATAERLTDHRLVDSTAVTHRIVHAVEELGLFYQYAGRPSDHLARAPGTTSGPK